MQHITQHDRLAPRYGAFLMKLICENCKQGDKGRYSTFFFNKKLITLCDECRWGIGVKSAEDKDKKDFEHISTPFWQHMGLKPNKREQAQLKYLKDHNMSWGDLRKARMANVPQTNEGVKAFQEHISKFGKENAPDVAFKKRS